MSSLGFAAVFMLCVESASVCEPVAIRASRFATIGDCHSSVAAAGRDLSRVRKGDTGLSVFCKSLDEICSEQTAPSASRIPHRSYDGLLVRTSTGGRNRKLPAIEGALSMLCKRPIEGDCF